ncbi:hypothetical protein HNR46_001610 [Haloferula luteola]|uniref:Uncharacterized protein n=1 Tax=Haloferula luteola TaxID=595692 RepID=A0A840V6Z3_9BACT|nr:hypothetical protein [Haloferula luteola]MBB5351374.1 hypothetical protein [Haloferula luteola]
MSDQLNLDLEGNDFETRLRFQWSENARRQREFWTPERLCLSWMQGTTPNDSDMRWWVAQPAYRRRYWLDLHQRAKQQAAQSRRAIAPFHIFEAEVFENAAIIERQDEALTVRFLDWIREDFKAGRSCSIDVSTASPGQRHRSQACLDEAIRRAGIPAECLGVERRSA